MVASTATGFINPTFSVSREQVVPQMLQLILILVILQILLQDLEKQKEVYYMVGDHIVDCYSLEDITTNN